MRRMEVGLL